MTKPIPYGFRVLVEMQLSEEKIGSIIVPNEAREKEDFGAVKGRLVAVGSEAFASLEDKPKVGDYVLVQKYCGMSIEEGKYRLCEDNDIWAKFEDDSKLSTHKVA